MPEFNGPDRIITLDAPTAGVLNISVETDLYSPWKEWVLGNYTFNTETDVNSATEEITIIDHSLHTGQDVIYDISGPENIGLVDGTTYFVRRITRNTFELYDTKANANAGPATTGRLDLTASGIGDGENHLLDADNSKFINAFRTIGGDPLGPGLDAGPYFFIQNQLIPASAPVPARDGWRIISTDEDQTINYQGNLIPEDSLLPIINVTPGRSVLHLGLQPITQRIDEVLNAAQLAVYNGCVYIDTINGNLGTTYPQGTAGYAAGSLADGLTIATALKLRKICLRGSIQLTAALTGFTIEGIRVDEIDTVDINGQDISGNSLNNVSVLGTIDTVTSPIEFNNCQVGIVSDFIGTMNHCGLTDTITLVAGQTNIVDCYSLAPGAQVVTFDFQATNLIDLFVSGFTGLFSIADSTNAASVVSVDLTSGVMTIDSDFLNGIITVRGVGTYINNSTITTLTDTGLVDQADVKIIKQMVAGNVTISLDDLTVTVLDEDDVTVLVVLDVSADGRVRTRTT